VCLFVLDEAIGYIFGCQLPARFRLPCKHWMMQFYTRNQPLPVSLFHPRWLLDGPPVIYSWKMATSVSSPDTSPSPNRTRARPSSFDIAIPRTRYASNGEQLIIDAATKAVQKLKSLPPGEKEEYASGFDQLASKLACKQDEITSSRQAMPSELPDAIPKQDVLFKRNRRRGYTAREAAEEEEKNQRRHAKEAIRQAESARAEEYIWSKELKLEHLARHATARAARESVASSLAPASARAQPQEAIEISSGSKEEEEYDMWHHRRWLVKSEPTDDAGDMAALVDTGSPLLLSQDSSKARNSEGSTNSNTNEMDENESSSESNEDALPSPSQLTELTREWTIRKKR
jgi:hypothetical protein